MNAEAESIICFLCRANLGRSQMAEGWYRFLSGLDDVGSAGLEDWSTDERYEGHPGKRIIAVMKERGIEISQQKVKQITQEMLSQIRLLVVLCECELPDWLVTSGVKTLYRPIPDPDTMDLDQTRIIRDRVEKIVLEVIAMNQNHQGTAV